MSEDKKVTKIFNRSNIVILCSFIVPVLLIHCVLSSMGFYPFGEKTLLIMDMKGQYVEFFSSLRYIHEDNSIFFSWSRAMGGEFLGLVAYYIASPLSFITLLFPVEELPAAMYLLTVLKIGLCGLSFSLFLEYGFNNRKGNFSVVAFSTCYALMSYNIVYGMCLMWLDGVILLPLILLGIEKIFKGKKGLIYFLSMAGLFICNYYTSYMVGIFAALYFIVKLISKICFDKTEIKNSLKQALVYCLRFGFNTIIAFCLAMPLLLPAIKDLSAGKLGHENYCPTDIVYNFNFIDVLKKLLPAQYDTITNSGALPSVYCGLFIVALAVLFILSEKINIREKIGHYLIAILLLVSFWNFKLDIVWHGFQYPNWFPYRYAFLLSALLIIMAYRFFASITIGKKVNLLVAAFLIIYAAAELPQNAVKIIEGLDGEFVYGSIDEYDNFLNKTKGLVDNAKSIDNGFYRMEKDYEYSKNDAMLLGYNGMTHYSSTFNVNVNNFTRNMGIAQTHIWNSGYGSTLLTDSLFNVKYKILEKSAPSAFKLKLNGNGAALYENTKVLPVAYAADEQLFDKTPQWGYDYFRNQEMLLSDLLGEYIQCFNMFSVKKENCSGGFNLKFTAQSENPVYLNMRGSGWANVYVNGNFVGNYFSSETLCNLYLGQFLPGDEIIVYVETDVSSFGEVICELDVKNVDYAVSKLHEGAMDITEHKGGSIKGTVNVRQNQVLFTSIPYSDGFRVKVDGNYVSKGKYADTFLVIPVEEGRHEIEISYLSEGFLEGIILMLSAVIAAMIYYRFETWKQLFVKIFAGRRLLNEKN